MLTTTVVQKMPLISFPIWLRTYCNNTDMDVLSEQRPLLGPLQEDFGPFRNDHPLALQLLVHSGVKWHSHNCGFPDRRSNSGNQTCTRPVKLYLIFLLFTPEFIDAYMIVV